MVIKSLGGRGKEGFPATCIIGNSNQLKYLVKDEAKSHCLNDQVCPYKCPKRASNLWSALDAIEGVGPSSLSEKFSNSTPTMDIDVDNRHFDDSDSGDKISTTAFVPVATVPLVPKVAMDASSPFSSREFLLSSENVQRQGKEKEIINDEGKKLAQKGE
ncbi:hypothetical protein Adt_21713 [Abeliophyllum distichum]|uniref:Uncharacterized protein n=1 Tax=Abeliophyllum distichum TaxID=126358 RepID=A0ABD1T079_9LAMI